MQSSLLWDEVYGYLKPFSLECSAFPELSSMQSRSLGGHTWDRAALGHPTPVPHWQRSVCLPAPLLRFTHLTALKGSGSSETGARMVLSFFSPSLWSCLPPHHIAPCLSENAFRNCSCRQLRALCDPCPAKHHCSRACEMCSSLLPLCWDFEPT